MQKATLLQFTAKYIAEYNAERLPTPRSRSHDALDADRREEPVTREAIARRRRPGCRQQQQQQALAPHALGTRKRTVTRRTIGQRSAARAPSHICVALCLSRLHARASTDASDFYRKAERDCRATLGRRQGEVRAVALAPDYPARTFLNARARVCVCVCTSVCVFCIVA